VGDEALEVGVGGVDRHLRGVHPHASLLDLHQHPQVSLVGTVAREADVLGLPLLPGLEEGVEHAVRDALLHVLRALEGVHLPEVHVVDLHAGERRVEVLQGRLPVRRQGLRHDEGDVPVSSA
jgi:hypothetical protein